MRRVRVPCSVRADPRQTAGMGRLPAARDGAGGTRTFVWVRRRNLWGLLQRNPPGARPEPLGRPAKTVDGGTVGAWD